MSVTSSTEGISDMGHIRAFCLLGGVYHDFDAAEAYFGPQLEAVGVRCQFERRQASLADVSIVDADVVFVYACILEESLDEQAAAGLVRFVESGGGLFAMHAATASFCGNKDYSALIGGRFIEHPPRHNFLVTPMQSPHAITAGIEAFTVNDELYIQECQADLSVHLVASYLNRMQPIAWTRTQGAGRVCHLALGHDLAVWQQPSVWRLVTNGLRWVGQRA